MFGGDVMWGWILSRGEENLIEIWEIIKKSSISFDFQIFQNYKKIMWHNLQTPPNHELPSHSRPPMNVEKCFLLHRRKKFLFMILHLFFTRKRKKGIGWVALKQHVGASGVWDELSATRLQHSEKHEKWCNKGKLSLPAYFIASFRNQND